ncbi:hypothetical protein HYALB_00006758 [Hymenoscyphus albidus]|uniref:GAT domain-containing protein n=1 Tax=Hymenoscyphus albidus TaxID=595503 RepID=A0A9N9M1M4_9HELO|nr:hypothetical protein HYALB_00006758 [Hymenoscyphus albidus]
MASVSQLQAKIRSLEEENTNLKATTLTGNALQERLQRLEEENAALKAQYPTKEFRPGNSPPEALRHSIEASLDEAASQHSNLLAELRGSIASKYRETLTYFVEELQKSFTSAVNSQKELVDWERKRAAWHRTRAQQLRRGRDTYRAEVYEITIGEYGDNVDRNTVDLVEHMNRRLDACLERLKLGMVPFDIDDYQDMDEVVADNTSSIPSYNRSNGLDYHIEKVEEALDIMELQSIETREKDKMIKQVQEKNAKLKQQLNTEKLIRKNPLYLASKLDRDLVDQFIDKFKDDDYEVTDEDAAQLFDYCKDLALRLNQANSKSKLRKDKIYSLEMERQQLKETRRELQRALDAAKAEALEASNKLQVQRQTGLNQPRNMTPESLYEENPYAEEVAKYKDQTIKKLRIDLARVRLRVEQMLSDGLIDMEHLKDANEKLAALGVTDGGESTEEKRKRISTDRNYVTRAELTEANVALEKALLDQATIIDERDAANERLRDLGLEIKNWEEGLYTSKSDDKSRKELEKALSRANKKIAALDKRSASTNNSDTLKGQVADLQQRRLADAEKKLKDCEERGAAVKKAADNMQMYNAEDRKRLQKQIEVWKRALKDCEERDKYTGDEELFEELERYRETCKKMVTAAYERAQKPDGNEDFKTRFEEFRNGMEEEKVLSDNLIKRMLASAGERFQQLREAKAERDSLRARVKDLKEKLRDCERRKSRTKSKSGDDILDDLKDELATTRKQLKDLLEDRQGSYVDSAEVDKLKEEIKRLTDELEEKTEDHKIAEDEGMDCYKRLVVVDQQFDELKEMYTKLGAQTDRDIAKAQGDIDKAFAARRAAEAELREVKKALTSGGSESSPGRSEKLQDIIDSLQEDINLYEDRVDQLNREVEELQAKNKTLREERTTFRKALKEEPKELKEAEKKVTQALEESKKIILGLEADYQNEQKVTARLRKERSQLQDVQAKLDAEKARADRLREELEQCRQERDEAPEVAELEFHLDRLETHRNDMRDLIMGRLGEEVTLLMEQVAAAADKTTSEVDDVAIEGGDAPNNIPDEEDEDFETRNHLYDHLARIKQIGVEFDKLVGAAGGIKIKESGDSNQSAQWLETITLLEAEWQKKCDKEKKDLRNRLAASEKAKLLKGGTKETKQGGKEPSRRSTRASAARSSKRKASDSPSKPSTNKKRKSNP